MHGYIYGLYLVGGVDHGVVGSWLVPELMVGWLVGGVVGVFFHMVK